MDIADAVRADLRDLVCDAEQGAYTTSTLAMLQRDVRLAVRACLGYSVTLVNPTSSAIRIHVIDEPLDLRTVGGSMRLRLESSSYGHAGELTFYASEPAAFDALATHLRGDDPDAYDDVALDGGLASEVIAPGISGLEDFTEVYRALGVLMHRGVGLDDARHQLERLAARRKVTLVRAAQELLSR